MPTERHRCRGEDLESRQCFVKEVTLRSDTREASASVTVGSWQMMGPRRAQPPLVLLCRAAGYGRRGESHPEHAANRAGTGSL